MKTITRDQIDNGTVTETEHFKFVTDASDLGWRPGQSIPLELSTELGNGQPLILMSSNGCRADYHQQFGCVSLVVFND